MAVGRVLFGSVILSFLLSLFGPLPEKYLSGNGLCYFSCTPLRFDSAVSSLDVITDHKQVNSTRRLGRHLGFRLRGMGYLGSRVSYHHNSTSSFQLIRLIKSGDLSLNPGPTAIQVVIGNRHRQTATLLMLLAIVHCRVCVTWTTLLWPSVNKCWNISRTIRNNCCFAFSKLDL